MNGSVDSRTCLRLTSAALWKADYRETAPRFYCTLNCTTTGRVFERSDVIQTFFDKITPAAPNTADHWGKKPVGVKCGMAARGVEMTARGEENAR